MQLRSLARQYNNNSSKKMISMTESEFTAVLRSAHRETAEERAARLAKVAEELEAAHHAEFNVDPWSL